MDNQLALLTLCGSVIALLFVASRAKKVLSFPEGNDQMKKISASIHNGAMAYLRRQYKILQSCLSSSLSWRPWDS